MRVLGLDVLKEESLELLDFSGLDLVEETSDTGVENANLLFSNHGHVLLLLEELSKLLTSVEEMLGGGIEIGTELGEGSDFSVLGKLELERTGDLLHGLDLGGGTDSGHRETDVDGGSDTLVEKLSLQEDLSISNRDHIGGNIGGHITSLGLNDGEGSQGTTFVLVGHLGCSLEETRMEIEDVSGVSLSARRSSEKKRHLSVGDGLLGEIVVDDEAVLAVVSEELTDSASGVRGQELEGSSLGSGGGNNDGVTEGVVILEDLHDVGNSRSLLANGDVDAVKSLGLVRVGVVEGSLLVDDSIDGDGSLSSLSVSNDELSLASSNGDLIKFNYYSKDLATISFIILYIYIEHPTNAAAFYESALVFE